MKNVMNTEPAVALGAAVTGFLQAFFLLLRAFNIGATAEMEQATTLIVQSLLMFPIIAGFLIRFFVFSPETHEEEVFDAFYEGMEAGK
jgi:hypothetical protein